MQLGADDDGAGQASEEDLDGVQHQTFGANRVDGVADADEEGLEIELAAGLHLGAIDFHPIHQDAPVPDQLVQVETKGGDVLRQFRLALLEGHEDPRFLLVGGAAHQEFHGQQGLAATGATADQGRAAARQAAICDVVEAHDAGRGLGEGGSGVVHGKMGCKGLSGQERFISSHNPS